MKSSSTTANFNSEAMDMEWVRGEIIGKGSFSSVYLGTRRRRRSEEIPNLMAVKSSLVSQSSSLQNEKEILTQFKDCPQILQCYGDDLSIEKNGEKFYNLFLEFASGGSLSQLMKNSGGSISETHVRGYTKSILQGIFNIHQKGFVHCDIKLQNILVCCSSDSKKKTMEVKIADFGLAKKTEELKKSDSGLWGTPLYMSPESISSNEIGSATDIWALGCIVSEMITGKPAWRCGSNSDVAALLYRIGFGDELPSIPDEISEEGRDFLSRCFVRDSTKRWSAEMLLNHPFVAHHSVSLPTNTIVIVQKKPSSSPRSAFDFPEWSCCSSSSPSISSSSSVFDDWRSEEEDCSSPIDRIRNLVVTNNQKLPSWSSSDGWITVR